MISVCFQLICILPSYAFQLARFCIPGERKLEVKTIVSCETDSRLVAKSSVESVDQYHGSIEELPANES